MFFASFLFHMVLPFHRSDYGKVPSEDAVMDALRPFNIVPGDYLVPCPGSPAAARTPEFTAKKRRAGHPHDRDATRRDAHGVGPRAAWSSSASSSWEGFSALTSRALPAGAPYAEVFRFAGTVAFGGVRRVSGSTHLWYRAMDDNAEVNH